MKGVMAILALLASFPRLGADFNSTEFRVILFKEEDSIGRSLLLFVTVLDNTTVTFEVVGTNYTDRFTAVSGNYTKVTLPAHLAVANTSQATGGVEVRSPNGTDLLVYAVLQDKNSTTSSFLALSSPVDALQPYSYIGEFCQVLWNYSEFSVDTVEPNLSPSFNNYTIIHPFIEEDEVDNNGTSVYDITYNLIEDENDGATRGIAVVEVDTSHGLWEYSLLCPCGLVWQRFPGNISTARAVVFRADPSNLIRFVPERDFYGNVSLTFLAWDATDGLMDGSVTSTENSTNSDFDPFSKDTRMFFIQVHPQNDPPLLNTTVQPRMASISENAALLDPPTGDSVTLFLSALDTDVDSSNAMGIAIVGVDSSSGVWQFTTDAGVNWTNISQSVNDSRALVLESQPEGMNLIRFIPNMDFNGESSFRYKLWDLTSDDTSGDSDVDTATDPVTGAFSMDSTTAHITVVPANSAPVATGTIHRYGSVEEDLVGYNNRHGFSVSHIASPVYRDADNRRDNGFEGCYYGFRGGIAVVDADFENGMWEYLNGTWTAFPDVSESSALLLRANVNPRIRFLPKKDYVGSATFLFKLWDLSNDYVYGSTNVNTTGCHVLTGPYSVDTVKAVLRIDPVNDPPVLHDDAQLNLIVEDLDTTANSGTTVDSLLGPVSEDVDGPKVGLAIIGIDERFGLWEYVCDNTSAWLNFKGGPPKVSEATLLLGHCRIRFIPDQNFNSEFDENGFARSESDFPYILIRSWDGYGTRYTNLRSDVDSRVDPDLVFSREIAYARIVVQGVNDPPILMLGTEKNFSSTFEEPAPPNRKVTPVSLVDPIWMTITDVDNALLSSVTFSFTRYDGFSEFVTVDTSGTDLEFNVIVDSLDFFEAVLFSSNSIASSIADYRRALIRTDYENYAEEPNATMRDIHIAIADNGLNGAQKEMDTAISGVNISLVNDSPELDLNTDIPGRHTNLQYFEGDPPLLLLAENHSLIDHDSPVLTGAVVTIVSPPDGTSEVLGVGSDSISVVHLGSRIELYGNGTPEEYSQVFSTVTYENTFSKPGNPSKATREVRFVVSDGQHASAASSAYIVFIPVNDPPEVYTDDNTRALTSTALFKEGEINGAVFRNLAVTDIDSSTLSYLEVTIKNPLDGDSERLEVREGTEIIGDASSRNYFIRRFLSEWTYFTSNSSLRMSGLSTVLEYEQILLTLRYYNSAEEPLNTTRNISITAFDGELHSKTATVFLAIQNVNDSPFFSNVLDVISPSIFEDIPLEDNHGYSLEEVAGRLILDNDRDAVKGVAIIAVDNQFGRWEYTTDFVNVTYVVEYPGANVTNTTGNTNAANDTGTLTVYSANWVPFSENTSIIESVVLRVNGTTTRVRFVPSKNFNGESTLRFVAWDSSDGLSDGSITDASDLSDIDPFSSDHRILTVTANRTNDAPLLSPSISFNLTTILEDDSDSSGDPVEELLSGVSDIDLIDTEHGIAVIGVDEKYGEWQFSVDGGGSWIPMQNVSIRSAVLLHSTPPRQNRIRFAPVSDFNGYSQLTFVAWDLTNGEPSGKTNVDVLMSDPVTGPYSRNHTTATILVEPVNDSPVLEDGSSLLTILEDVPVDSNKGTSVGDIVNQTFYDVDADPGLNYEPNTDIGIALVGVDVRYGEWQYWCPDTSEWKVFIGDFAFGVTLPLHPRVEKATLLLSNCRIRFLPNLHFNTLKDLQGDYRPPSDVAFITIRGWDNTGRSTGESGMYARDTTYNQDSHLNEFSSETFNATINVTSVNDLPLLSISQTDSGVIFRTEFLEDSAFVYITDPPSVRLIDFDNARLDSVTVCVENSVDPDSEIIDVVGDNSTVEVTGSTVVVRLKGAVYQLQTMYTIYSNTPHPSKSSLRIMSSPGHDSAAIEAYEVLLRHLVYKNLHPEPTNGTREISFAVNDGEDVNDKVRTFVDVTLRAENRPVVMIATRTVYFTEEEASMIPLTSSDLSLTDRDHNEFFFMSGATLTFKILPRSSLESLSVNLSAVQSSYDLIQMYFPDNGTLVVSGEAPVSQYQEVLNNVFYHNLEEEPRPGHQSVCIQVTDAHGLTSQPVSIVIEVSLVNDRPPEISAPSEPYVFVEGSPFTLLQDISISDNDTGGGDLYIYQLNATISNPFDGDNEEISAMGSSNVNVMVEGFSVVLTGPATLEDFQEVLSTLKYINTAEEPNTDERYIDIVVRDANFTSDEVSVTVRFSLVNDLPIIDLNGPLSPDVDIVVNYVEGSGPQPIVDPLNLTVSDNDHQYLVSVRVELTNPYDSPLEVLSIDFTITNSTNMSTITSNTNSTSSTSITAITNSTSNTNSTNSTKIATITSNTNNTNITASTNSTGGTNITGNTKSTNIMSIYNRTTGVLTLSGWASLKDYQKVLRTLTYENMEALPGHPSAEMRIIRFVAFDGLAYSKVSTAFVKFQSVNDAPFFDLNGNLPGRDYSTSFTEEGPPVRLSSRDMMLNDVDNTSLESVTVRITNLLDGDQEVLSVPYTLSYIYSTFSTSGVLRLIGPEKVSQFREAASLVQYQNLADEPTFDQRIIEFVASDGLLDSLPYYTRVDMIPVNDPPRLQIELCQNLTCENMTLDSSTYNSTNATDNSNSTSLSGDETTCPQLHYNSTTPNTTCPLGSSSELNSTVSTPNHHTVRRRSAPSWDLFGIQNGTNSTVEYNPIPFSTEYVENSPSVQITNPLVVLVEDDDDTQVQLSLVMSGVLDPGFESVFFHTELISSNLTAKLAPYVSQVCPDQNNTFISFNLTANFTLDEMAEALRALYYCNFDEFSTSGTRTVSMYVADAQDGRSDVQMAYIDVISVNDEPFLIKDILTVVTITEEGNYTLPALSYFNDHEETLTPFSIEIVLVDPDVGEARVDPTMGGIVYVSALNDYGVRTVWYQACDSLGACSSPLNLTIIITPVNDPPSFGITNLTVLEDTIVSLNLPQDLNVTDPEDVLSADSFSVITMPQVGMLEYAGGTLVYTPPTHYHTPNGSDPVMFVLMVCDSDANNQLCVNQTISITYRSVNDAPLLPPIVVEIYEDSPYVADLISMISDVEESTVESERVELLHPLPQHGTVTYNSTTGILMYQPDPNYFGTDLIVFQACDSTDECNFNGMVNLTVLAVNDQPEVENFTVYLLEDQHNVFSLCSHIYDVDSISSEHNATYITSGNRTVTVNFYELLRLHLVDPSSGRYVNYLVSPANATLRVFDAHGIIGYDPVSEFVGVDYFTYAVCDVCHTARDDELGRVELPLECLKQIEENGGGSLRTDNTNITCVEREVRVVVRNVDDVPVISDISSLVPVGGSVTISPFNESQASSPHSTEGYLYTDSTTPVFEPDDLQLTIAASMGHDLRELRLNTDSDIDELSLRVFSPPSSGTAVVKSNGQFPNFLYTPNPTFQGYDSFEYEVCDKLYTTHHVAQCIESDIVDESTLVQCSRGTVWIFVVSEGPNISSVVAVSSQTNTPENNWEFDVDSKVSRGDKIWINFAIPTNMPPHGRAGETVSQEGVDQIFLFGTPFISDQIAPMVYEGKWINDTLFELEIVDEGYPQPEIPIGQWEVRVSDGVSPCGGFDPETRNPVVSSRYCLQDAQGTSVHSTAISEPITGNFGLKLPEITFVKIIPDAPSKKTELTKDIFLNTQIVIYLQEPLSHFQLDQYCQKDPHLLLDPSLVGQGARLTISGCQNVMPTSENAAVVYSENIARYDLPYLSNRNRRNVDEEKDRRKRDSSLTKLPSYSEITFKVVAMPTSRSMGIDSVTFADSVKEKFNIAALAEAVSATTGVPMAEYLNYSVPRPPSSHLQFEHSEATTPTIVSVRCTSDDSFFNSGDQLDIVFNRITDTPPVQNTSQIDSIFRFQPSIGTNYSGIWSDLKTLQIIIFKGSNEEISLRQFTVSFTPTYIDMTTPLLFDHADLSAGKPWCVGINVCGVKFSSLSVGVCDNYSVSCRAFEPWTGTVLLKEYKLDLLLVIAPILAFIILVTFCGIISRPVYKYFRRIHFKYKARKLDKWFWRRFDDIADMNLNQSPMCLPENEMPAAEVEGWNKNQEEIGTESVNVTSENGSEDQQGSETESAKVRIQNGKEEQCGSETESAKQEEEMGRCNQKSSENHTWNGNQYNTKVQRQTLNMNVKSRNGNEKEIVHTPQHSCETEAQATWSSPLQPERREDPFMCNVGCN